MLIIRVLFIFLKTIIFQSNLDLIYGQNILCNYEGVWKYVIDYLNSQICRLYQNKFPFWEEL